ncbi:MAG: hypothetical protein HDQ44_03710 [Desulfovibrio sp.]|nr:hypothetical protein [Desulfovibrio sp.]
MLNLPCLAPVLFTIVMGTGAFAIASLEMASYLSWLQYPALVLNCFNYLLFFCLAFWALLSWRSNLALIREHFQSPASCALYSACGIALLVLGAQALHFELGLVTALCFWSAGALLTIGLNFTIMLRFFLHPGLNLTHITPVFFVPVAGLVVVPVAGFQLAANVDEVLGGIITLVSILGLGGGVALYFGLFSIMLQRHLLIAPLPEQLAPTFWIHLAPAGWAGVSLTAFAANILPPEYNGAAMLLALLLFGATLWWLVMVIIIGLRAAYARRLPFNLSWWAFVFPAGSVTILAQRIDLAPVHSLFPILWGLLALLWLLCACGTIWSHKQNFVSFCKK